MQTLLPLAEQVAQRLKQRGETIAVAESSTGGLICAALLAVPGASAYFVSGAVIYTAKAREGLFEINLDKLQGIRSASEPYAKLLAETAQQRFETTWGLSETGASGPSGNRYGDDPGHSCLALCGPHSASITIETKNADRLANMRAFALAGLQLFLDTLSQKNEQR